MPDDPFPPAPPAVRQPDLPAIPRQRGERVARVLNWQPVDGNPSLIGKATVTFAGGWTVPSIPIFKRADGSLSAGTPSYPVVGPDGVQQRDEAGKRQYTAALFFTDNQGRRRWSELVLAALADAGITGAAP
jgi:hypothetical protein